VVALSGAGRDDHVGTLRERLGNEEFQLAGLVAARSQARLVISFHQETRTTQFLAEAGQVVNRCRQVCQRNTRQLFKFHGFLGASSQMIRIQGRGIKERYLDF
jgi:hypothetical protein